MPPILTCNSTLVSTVLPVYVSYNALVKYQRVTADAQSSTIKIKGISFPNPLFTENPNAPPPTDQQVQAHSLTVQKWFIFWISRSFCELVEGLFFLRYVIPFYGMIKLVFNCWMLSRISIASTLWNTPEAEEESISIQSAKWHDFTTGGCGLVFYTFLKPLLDYPLDDIVSSGGGPSAWVSYATGAVSQGLSSTISSTLSSDAPSEFGSVLGSSYVLVKGMFTSEKVVSKASTPEVKSKEVTNSPITTSAAGTPSTDFDYDLIENAEAEGLTQRKKGWVW